MTEPAELNTLLAKAYSYAGLGLEIFPVRADSKQPHTKNGMKDATTDLEQIERWWNRWPDALIGCRIPADVVVLDIDPRDGGKETWRALRAEIEPWPITRTHLSGRNDGGGHTWWRHPGGKLNSRRLNAWAENRGLGVNKKGRHTAGIDILHHGHRYTILPPSPHPETGEPYRWAKGRGLSVEPAPMPRLLVELLVDDRETAESKPSEGPEYREVDSPADHYSATTAWTDLLPAHGWEVVEGDGDEDGSLWKHPEATTGHSATIRNGCLFVYSTSTGFEPTEPGDPHGYTPFAAYAVLEHDGDQASAAGAVRRTMAERSDVEPEATPDERSTWAPVDLTSALAGDDVEPPELWERVDGTCLVYPGRTHWFQGESESCKSWAAQVITADVIRLGADVLYVDHEDDERGIVARLRALGCGIDQIRDHLVYVRPDEPLRDGPALADFEAVLADRTYRLAVVDGVTEAMVTEGLEINSNTDAALWNRLLPKRLAGTGASVVAIDHVTKSKEDQGRYAIGGQHKLAGVTGAVYRFVTERPLSRATDRDVEGRIVVKVMKDRPGYVRGLAPDSNVGTLVLIARMDGSITASVELPTEKAPADMNVVHKVLRYLDTYDGSSKNKIETEVEGHNPAIRAAIRWMHEEEWVEIRKEGQSHRVYLTDLGREQVVR